MALGAGTPESIEGSVERVTFHSEESGFCVLRVKMRGHREVETVIGHAPHIVAGEWIRAEGEWITDRQHGPQFKAESLKSLPPDSREGIERFLGSGLIEGIGPVYAKKLVEHFGTEIFDIIDKNSARLETVPGIGPTRRQRIKASWNEAREVRAIMAFLMSHKVSTARAFRIYKTYGEEAITKVRDNPYILARDIRGIGFKTADTIAGSLGIEGDHPLRARAGVEYVLQEATAQGHCALHREELVEQAERILGITDDVIDAAIDHGLEEQRLIEDKTPEQGVLIYLANLYEAEVGLARRIAELARQPHPLPHLAIEKAIPWVEQQIGLELAPAQRDALRLAAEETLCVITGGPGVGKTTLIRALLRIFEAKKLKCVLAAPTGRAAKRMQEATGHDASTLHRLLGWEPALGRFKHDRDEPLKGQVFIIDESSMIDLPLAYAVLQAIPDGATVLLVGDADQLPSVGPGSVLGDLINSQRVGVARLNEIFRQAASSAIITNAHRINEGEMPFSGSPNQPADFYMVEEDNPERCVSKIVDLFKRQIPQRFGFDPMQDVQLLTPMQRGGLGARALNQALQQALNPGADRVERFGAMYGSGDKVMQVQNNYDKDVFNGDIGRVLHVDREDRLVVVEFGKRKIEYTFNELDELLPAFAITIHKSQGSEYPCVVIPLHTQHFVMLQRNLLYTAVTRGKQLVLLVGSKQAIAMAVGRADTGGRRTALTERLAAALPARV